MQIELFSIEGQTYFVTGASSGIGKAIALHLLDIGANVMAVSRDMEKLQQLSVESTNLPGNLMIQSVDVTDQKGLDFAIKITEQNFGTLNGAVLAAGMNIREPFLNVSAENWKQILDTNLTGFFNSIQSVCKSLSKNGGSIVPIGSLSTEIAYPNNAAYSASKAGLTQLSRVLAAEMAEYGVRVNVLVPGRIITPLIKSVLSDSKQMDWMRSRIPMKRLGKVEDLLGPVQFLLSDASAYMTGTLVVVDGGWSILA